jgi:hypothetical protein
MKQSDQETREALQNNINELKAQLDAQQARLDEQVAVPFELKPGDIHDAGHCLFLCCQDGLKVSLNDQSWGTSEIGSNYRVCDPCENNLLGTFDEVFVRRSQAREELRQELKEGFMKMKDSYNDRVTDCPPGGCSWRIESMSLGSFIDNLFDGKNCDGSDRDE